MGYGIPFRYLVGISVLTNVYLFGILGDEDFGKYP